MSANKTQVGGAHYQATVQHWDVVAVLYGIGYFLGNISKYITRWRRKNGLQDLEKAAHYTQKTIELLHTGSIAFGHVLDQPQLILLTKFVEQYTEDADLLRKVMAARDVSVLHHALAVMQDLINTERERLAALPVLRSTRDQWGLDVALATSKRSTCVRRRVGCFLVDAHGNELATGYNGRAAGLPHCNEGHACAGATAPSGTALDACEAIHAEQNALIKVRDKYAIHTCYTTASPCIHCVKMLMNTGCRRIVFLEEYPHPEARRLWEASFQPGTDGICGREWIKGSL